MGRLTHLERLEAESIQILREAVAESERPVMLYSVGKDSSVMLHLAINLNLDRPIPFDPYADNRDLGGFILVDLLKLGTRTVGATVAHPKYKVNVNTLEHVAAKTLELNEIGVCNLNLDRPIPFDPYADNRDLGGFILVDRFTNDTVAAGLLHFALRRASNVQWQAVEVDADARARLKGQRPAVVWFTGLSGAGKSTIANLVEKKLHRQGSHTYLLDGDNVRHGLTRDLGFTAADRVENVRRVAEVARLMADAGLIVLVSLISPFRAERQLARDLLADHVFMEVHVDAPVTVAEHRDRKGLYAKARRGELVNFTGIDSPYEPPESPELRLDTSGPVPPDASADQVIETLRAAGILTPATAG